MIGWIRKWLGLGRQQISSAPRVRPGDRLVSTSDLYGRWDAAGTDDDNVRHWRNADGLSADAAGSASNRAILRQRARYECHENNCYGFGIVRTLANDLFGTGPRLEMMLDNDSDNAEIEALWRAWADEVQLADKLRLAHAARIVDGEYFLLMTTNDALQFDAKLDLRAIECDQCCSPFYAATMPTVTGLGTVSQVDGITFDGAGNPVSYEFLEAHPGDPMAMYGRSVQVPARYVLHGFRPYRVGQRRGVSEVAPALPLFAQMRRFLQATLDAAEAAARIPFWIYTDGIAGAAQVPPLQTLDLERNTATTMPEGWKVGQLDAKHPSTTFAMFKSELLREIARCMDIPYNLAAGDSSGYNYASGRLDHQSYFRRTSIDRVQYGLVLDRIFAEWLREVSLVNGLLPLKLANPRVAKHRWGWDAAPHVDPSKEAAAVAMLWQLGLTTDDEYLLSRNINPVEHFSRMQTQLERRKSLGLPLPGFAPMQVTIQDTPPDGSSGEPSNNQQRAA